MTAAVLAATAQENTSSLNSTALSNTTLNNTTLNVSLNQTQNTTAIEPVNATSNETLIAAPQANLNETYNETLNQTEMNETVPAETEFAPVQNETVPVMNETNETVPAETEFAPVQNETAAAQNIAMPENALPKAEPANGARAITIGSQPKIAQLGSTSTDTVFVIGGGLKTPKLAELGKVRLMMWPTSQVG
jgi:hypothetical protein